MRGSLLSFGFPRQSFTYGHSNNYTKQSARDIVGEVSFYLRADDEESPWQNPWCGGWDRAAILDLPDLRFTTMLSLNRECKN